MKKTLTLLAASLIFTPVVLGQGEASAQEVPQTAPETSVKATPKIDGPVLISVSSKGHDVRSVLHDMFKQVEKSFVLEPNIRFQLYLSLEKIEFEEALRLVCKMSELNIDVQNGIYFIHGKKTTKPPTAVKGAFEAKPAPKGKLPTTVLTKKLTTRLDKVDIRKLLANITQQTGVVFELGKDVPSYKLDAYLIQTSLKFALETICSAANLQYSFTDKMTIAISKAPNPNRVNVVGDSGA